MPGSAPRLNPVKKKKYFLSEVQPSHHLQIDEHILRGRNPVCAHETWS